MIRYRAIFLILLFLTGPAPDIAQGGIGGRQQLLYFDPDSAQGNLGHLKDAFNSFLQGAGLDITAQPVSRIEAFETLAPEATFLVIPRWYLHTPEADLLMPLLVLSRKGNQSFRKLIMAQAGSNLQATQLEGRKVAMATINRDAARSRLRQTLLVPFGLEEHPPQFVFTSRDYDSLIALLLGKVEAAVISASSLEQLLTMNPKLVKRLKTIGRSAPIATPVLSQRGPSGEQEQLLKSLLKLGPGEQQENFMQLLGFDAWFPFPTQRDGRSRP